MSSSDETTAAPVGSGEATGQALQTAGSEELRAQVLEALKVVHDPEIPVNIYELGLIYKRLGQTDRAATEFQEASATITADTAETHINLGLAYRSQNRLADAEAELGRALELDPQNAEANYCLALLYYDRGQPNMAVVKLEE
ncbi:MAG TPA: tetratricopeptide repeat protein, partial [Trueperaceae bacterium]|nr:tetratricopeptide repeat protein [Trueperaceae bacterium]